MVDAQLKLYIGTTEYGVSGKPVSFSNAIAGEITEHLLNPFYLWNDKGGVLNSVPAQNVSIIVEDMWIQDEVMGSSDGTSNQTYNTKATPILVDDNIDLKVNSVAWERVTTFSGQSATAKVYTITTAGLVQFGDGVNGLIPVLGETITITYVPDLVSYGKDIYEGLWFEVKSTGVTSNVVNVVDENQNASGTGVVTVTNTIVSAVSGVWLRGDFDHSGTNYFTGGSFDEDTGVLTLGSALPTTDAPVIVSYSYVPLDDLESSYTAIGEETSHDFTNQIPQNNAKLLYFRLNIPAIATPTGGSNYCFRLKVAYDQ